MLNKKKVIIFVIIGILIIVGLVFLIKQFVVINPEEEISQEYIPQAEISDEDLRKTIVALYFAEKESGTLVQEGRLIDAKLLLENPYETLIQMLILGPEASSYERLIPEGTLLNKVELKGEVLEVDFSKDFLNFKDDTYKEKAIESIQKTVSALSEVNGVKIFVEGEEIVWSRLFWIITKILIYSDLKLLYIKIYLLIFTDFRIKS